MLRVEVILDPASGGPDETIAHVRIVNDGTGSAVFGNYYADVVENGRRRRVKVARFPRASGALALVRAVLERAKV
jgi:hypothetical protein